jgi:predicted phage terminase large subunit-like protein
MDTALSARNPDDLSSTLWNCSELFVRLERNKLQNSLYDFVLAAWHLVEPSQEFVPNWHIETLCKLLQDVTLGKEPQRRWVINIPPGTLKSLLIQVFWPSWVWARSPEKRFLTASYGQSLTIRDNLRVRDIVESAWFQALFPLKLVEDQNTKTRYNTEKGGWRIASSVGGQAIGEHPDFIVIDDAATAQQAESEPERRTVQDWFDRTISPRGVTRRNLVVIVIGQRLHQEDLPGYLMKKGGWGTVVFPMRYVKTREATDEKPAYTADPRDPRTDEGELLAPQLIAEDRVRQLERDLGPYGTSGQLQQTPAPEGGGLFKREWFNYVDVVPTQLRKVRGWDTAASEGKGDYTVGVQMGEEFEWKRDPVTQARSLVSTGRFYVIDVVRQQLGPDGVDKLMLATAKADGCAQREEKEGGASGKVVIQARAKSLKGHDYAGVQVSGSKITRAKPFRSQCEAGNVYLKRAAWNKEYVDELSNFPTARHDDQVDASSCSFNAVLLEEPPRLLSCVL